LGFYAAQNGSFRRRFGSPIGPIFKDQAVLRRKREITHTVTTTINLLKPNDIYIYVVPQR